MRQRHLRLVSAARFRNVSVFDLVPDRNPPFDPGSTSREPEFVTSFDRVIELHVAITILFITIFFNNRLDCLITNAVFKEF